MRKILMLLIALVLITATSVFAGTVRDENAAKELTNKVMAKVVAGDLDAAFKIMKPYIPISGAEIDSAASQTKVTMEQNSTRYGAPIVFEFIDSKKIGDSLLRLRYVEKTAHQALPWSFYFYKTKEGWILNSFDWKDTFKELFSN